MKLGYADPPYPGLAHLYSDQPDFSGEVDHAALIADLEASFDGWVLHTNTPAIPVLAGMLPKTARWGAWVKSFAAFKKGVRPAYAWEPVIFKPMRRMAENYSGSFVQRDWIEAPMTMRRGFVGAKPEAVCHWAFEVVGADPSDEFTDLFPGSGAVTRAWQSWRPQLHLFDRPYDPAADGIGSYYDAIAEIGRRVKAGEEPVPTTGYFGDLHT